MKQRIRENPKSEIRNPKSGSTLVEVLASILALGIGVTMVATLFPTSILRGINATRLTRGTIHRYNAEAWIDVFTDQLVHNPDFAADPRIHFDASLGAMYQGNNYVVDPIGWQVIQQDNDIATARYFGDAAATFGTGRLERYNGFNNRMAALNPTQFAIARQVAESPDSWVEPLKGEFVVTPAYTAGSTSITITGPAMGDLMSLSSQIPTAATDPATLRIVMLDGSGKFSHTRELTSGSTIVPATGTITWATGGALPMGFTPATVRIQTHERQFTWMLTVRNRSEIGSPDIKKANVDVVVFFRRQYSTAHENTAWTFAGGGLTYTVQSPTGAALPLPPGTPRPFLKRGAWLCDTINARWYRIQRVVNEDSATPRVVLETAPPIGETLTRGVILPTVVEVYSLGTKQ
jgi:Tfp pilus assembly protein PilV